MASRGGDACPLCGRAPLPTLYESRDPRFNRPERFRVGWCDACEVASTHPVPADLLTYYEAAYDPYRPDGGTGLRPRLARAEAALRPSAVLAGPAGRLLDVGCGNGAYLEAMALRGHRVLGIDLSPRATALVRRRGLPALTADFLAAPLDGAAFDAITMNHYLEHSPDPRASLRQARRLLRSGGRLVVGVPSFASWTRRAFGPDWSDLELPRHLFHFTPRGLVRLVESEGFTVDTVRADPTADANSILTSLQVRTRTRGDPGLARAYPALHALLYPVALPLALARRSAWICLGARAPPGAAGVNP